MLLLCHGVKERRNILCDPKQQSLCWSASEELLQIARLKKRRAGRSELPFASYLREGRIIAQILGGEEK